MRVIKACLIYIIFSIIGGSMLITAVPQNLMAFASNPTCAKTLLGLPVWYRGLTKGSGSTKADCEVITPTMSGSTHDINEFVWTIVLNVSEAALMMAGYIAGFFVLFGGFQFLTTNGKPEAAAKARSTIMNATIGLVIAISAVAIVNFIVERLGMT